MGIEELLPEEADRVVIECYYCHEPTSCQINYNREHNWSIYECFNCDKTYLMCWDDKNNWYYEQKEGQNDKRI